MDHFRSVTRKLQTSGRQDKGIFVIGCCYGKLKPAFEYKAKGNYYDYRGQKFWELISGDADLYSKLIGYIGEMANEHNKDFREKYNQVVDRLAKEFLTRFSTANGDIDWEKLVEFTSAVPQPKAVKSTAKETKPPTFPFL